ASNTNTNTVRTHRRRRTNEPTKTEDGSKGERRSIKNGDRGRETTEQSYENPKPPKPTGKRLTLRRRPPQNITNRTENNSPRRNRD
ncbi:hypothetical protein A2U01_0070603, partial [Trifolium medium]|nr:hypothetical protein [Trifolium medium]